MKASLIVALLSLSLGAAAAEAPAPKDKDAGARAARHDCMDMHDKAQGGKKDREAHKEMKERHADAKGAMAKGDMPCMDEKANAKTPPPAK